MTQSFAVFLRGVNVNGTRMKMDELKKAFVTMGYKDIKTLLASGNVVVSSDLEDMTLMDHKMHIEMALSLYFGYEAYVIVKSPEEVATIVEEGRSHKIPDGYHHYLMLSNDPSLGQVLNEIFVDCEQADEEAFYNEPNGSYWVVPKGQTLESEFGEKVLGKKGFKDHLTSRTMNTVVKVHKVLEERAK